MDIFISNKNRSQIIKLPVIPAEVMISSPNNNETFTTVAQGDIKLIGPSGLKGLSISTFFPIKNYPFLKDRTYKGMEYVNIIEKWKEIKEPIRLIITSKKPLINMLCAIEEFEYGIRDGSGDITYSLTLSEFKLLPLQKRKS